MMGRELKLDKKTISPLTEEGYTRTFAALVDRNSTEYDVMLDMTRELLTESKFYKEPGIRMLSVGAGRGHLEERMVKELGLKLECFVGVEPVALHAKILTGVMERLGVPHHVHNSYFHKEFQFDEKHGNQKYDLILFSHCLYGFDDPYGAVTHAVKFLNPWGKILIFIQPEPKDTCWFKLSSNLPDNNLTETRPTIEYHELTAQKIQSHIQKYYTEISVFLTEKLGHVNVDKFVRAGEESRDDDVIYFFLLAEYRDLSREDREKVHQIVVECCDVVEGEYLMRQECAGVLISVASEDIR